MKFDKKWLSVFILLFVIVQIVFIEVDIPTYLSYSRGPYSDEGLNTYAIRNWINSDFKVFPVSDNFIKAPLLSIFLFIPFCLFENDLFAGRLTIVLLVAALIWLLQRENRYWSFLALLFIAVPTLFHFSRLMLGDLLSVFFPLVTILVFLQRIKAKKRIDWKRYFVFILIGSLGLGFKVQSLPLFFLLFLVALFVPVDNLKFKSKVLVLLLGFLPVFLLFSISFSIHLNLVQYIASAVPSFFTGNNVSIFNVIEGNWKLLCYSSVDGTSIMSLAIFVFAGLIVMLIKTNTGKFILIIPILIFFIIELGALSMVYCPPRYTVGIYLIVLVCLIYCIDYFISKGKPIVFSILFLGLSILVGRQLKDDFFERKFTFFEKNKALSKNKDIRVMIGSWAPGFTFLSETQIAYPIWDTYLSYLEIEQPVNYYEADLILAENDEKDSGGAFLKRRIIITQLPKVDSLVCASWKLNFYKCEDK